MMDGPYFYIGHHQSRHRGKVTEGTLQDARDYTYDTVTAPITSQKYHERVLSQISRHNAKVKESAPLESSSGAPIQVPCLSLDPLTSDDTDLAPGETISQLVCTTSTWIDLASHDPLVSEVSRQILCQEMTYASFCGATHVMIEGPKMHSGHVPSHAGLTLYARAVQEALRLAPYAQIHIRLPIIYSASSSTALPGVDTAELADLANLAGTKSATITDLDDSLIFDHLTSWDVWHVVRYVCRYSSRLSVALIASPRLPRLEVQSRWFSEPVRILEIPGPCFVANKHGILVLPKTHQQLVSRMMKLRLIPWLLLSAVGPLPGRSWTSQQQDPTPAQAFTEKQSGKYKNDMPYIEYVRKHMQTKQPPKTPMERFGQGFQDYLQNPLQPLTDNLESITYEVFEKDPVKYDWYEAAISQALTDWVTHGKPTSKSGRVTLAVVGAGRGPLVTRALAASDVAEVPINIWAIEKNPNAFVLLQRHNRDKWGNRVHLVHTDMRMWPGPTAEDIAQEDQQSKGDGFTPVVLPTEAKSDAYTTVDILVSELLGSFGDNELSPECLDGVQHLLTPEHGISIPSSYTAHLTPIAAPKLHADIAQRVAGGDADAWEVPYVVMLHSVDYLSKRDSSSASLSLSNSGEDQPTQDKLPHVQQAWEFAHPLPPAFIRNSQLHDAMGGNAHNSRFARLQFHCRDRGVCHGLAGYFETVLYSPRSITGAAGREATSDETVELSINPVTMVAKSEDMISWFPIFFPLETPLYVPDDAEIHTSMWRQTDGRKVWYEWVAEVFGLVGASSAQQRRVRLGASKLHSSAKNGCLM